MLNIKCYFRAFVVTLHAMTLFEIDVTQRSRFLDYYLDSDHMLPCLVTSIWFFMWCYKDIVVSPLLNCRQKNACTSPYSTFRCCHFISFVTLFQYFCDSFFYYKLCNSIKICKLCNLRKQLFRSNTILKSQLYHYICKIFWIMISFACLEIFWLKMKKKIKRLKNMTVLF